MSAEVYIGSRTTTLWALLAIIAGVVAFVTIFINWETMTFSFVESVKIEATAIDMLNNKGVISGVSGDLEYSFIGKIPFIIGIVGIVGAVLSLISIFFDRKKGISYLNALVFLVALALCVVFVACGFGSDLLTGTYKDLTEAFSFDFQAGIGFIIAFIACIAGFIFAAFDAKDNS